MRSFEYQALFREPDIRVRSDKILLLAKANSLGHPRLGLVIGKKHLKRAVQRNARKRVIRESFRINQKQIVNYDMIIIALAGISSVSRENLSESLNTAWQRLNQLAKKSQ